MEPTESTRGKVCRFEQASFFFDVCERVYELRFTQRLRFSLGSIRLNDPPLGRVGRLNGRGGMSPGPSLSGLRARLSQRESKSDRKNPVFNCMILGRVKSDPGMVRYHVIDGKQAAF